MQGLSRMKKNASKIKKTKRFERWRKIEEFLEEEMEKYLELHKEHEKDLRYIG